MPTFEEIVQAKYRFAKSRWHESGETAGFKKYPDRTFFVMGWCGQAAAPGYALQVLAERLGDPDALRMAQASLDWLSRAEFYQEGFHTWYDYEARQWSHEELLSQGQAMLNFARAIRVGRERVAPTAQWEAFLRHACDVHAARILADDWRPRSTDQAFFIAPLCEASRLFDNPTYRQAAVKAAEHYGQRHVSMQEPYWGGTLDARCEDKEGAYAALQGFLAVYEGTGDRRFLEWARHACDVVLTYVVIWDIDLPPGRLRNHAFKTRGWTVVSPQNQHIDVFGVLIAPEIYRLGQILNDSQLQQLALLMYRSCGQLLDPYGSQGEQPQHTNYAQRGDVNDVFALRGGYAETWTVFWITAHFLARPHGCKSWALPSGRRPVDSRSRPSRKTSRGNGSVAVALHRASTAPERMPEVLSRSRGRRARGRWPTVPAHAVEVDLGAAVVADDVAGLGKSLDAGGIGDRVDPGSGLSDVAVGEGDDPLALPKIGPRG